VVVVTESETTFIRMAQNGDRNAFGELVLRYAHGVQHVIYRMCGNAQIAEDAAQETFIRAWLNLSSFRPQASLRNWLYRIAVNTAIDMLRKEKHILPGAVEDFFLMDERPGPEALFLNREQIALVKRTILSLPEASRAVLVLREYEGLSYQEISEVLEIPVGTVMSRLNYARNLLKEKLKKHDVKSEAAYV
jgi:RNA polymerase sigma-70 factor (ECF subfamily)